MPVDDSATTTTTVSTTGSETLTSSSSTDGSEVDILFQESPPMSTYLVALVVAPLVKKFAMGGRNGDIPVYVSAVAVSGVAQQPP